MCKVRDMEFGLWGCIMDRAQRLMQKFIIFILSCMVLFAVSGMASAKMYIYELPDGSRMITDHALNNKYYKLIRTGHSVEGMGVIVASKNRQFFRIDPTAYDKLIRRLAQRHDLEFSLVKAVMHAESAFNPYAKSRKGAIGLMQIMPSTAQQYGVDDVYDPVQNIDAGVRHLKYLSGLFRDKPHLVVAAYNAGENAVKRHRGIPPYPETKKYVKKVLRFKQRYAALN